MTLLSKSAAAAFVAATLLTPSFASAGVSVGQAAEQGASVRRIGWRPTISNRDRSNICPPNFKWIDTKCVHWLR
ncbi:MAG TPA: hypothetical protein VIG36_02645 [Methylocystis sp.]|jgi:hypothetical protein